MKKLALAFLLIIMCVMPVQAGDDWEEQDIEMYVDYEYEDEYYEDVEMNYAPYAYYGFDDINKIQHTLDFYEFDYEQGCYYVKISLRIVGKTIIYCDYSSGKLKETVLTKNYIGHNAKGLRNSAAFDADGDLWFIDTKGRLSMIQDIDPDNFTVYLYRANNDGVSLLYGIKELRLNGEDLIDSIMMPYGEVIALDFK